MMQTVYDSDGNAYTVDSVDAREYIAMGGYSLTKPEDEIAIELKQERNTKPVKREIK